MKGIGKNYEIEQATIYDNNDVYIDMTSLGLIGVSFKMADYSFLSFYFIKNNINLAVNVNKKMKFMIF